MARYFFLSSTIVPNSYAATGIRTHVSRVAPDWNLSDALLTDLHGHGLLVSLVKRWCKSGKVDVCGTAKSVRQTISNDLAYCCGVPVDKPIIVFFVSLSLSKFSLIIAPTKSLV